MTIPTGRRGKVSLRTRPVPSRGILQQRSIPTAVNSGQQDSKQRRRQCSRPLGFGALSLALGGRCSILARPSMEAAFGLSCDPVHDCQALKDPGWDGVIMEAAGIQRRQSREACAPETDWPPSVRRGAVCGVAMSTGCRE